MKLLYCTFLCIILLLTNISNASDAYTDYYIENMRISFPSHWKMTQNEARSFSFSNKQGIYHLSCKLTLQSCANEEFFYGDAAKIYDSFFSNLPCSKLKTKVEFRIDERLGYYWTGIQTYNPNTGYYGPEINYYGLVIVHGSTLVRIDGTVSGNNSHGYANYFKGIYEGIRLYSDSVYISSENNYRYSAVLNGVTFHTPIHWNLYSKENGEYLYRIIGADNGINQAFLFNVYDNTQRQHYGALLQYQAFEYQLKSQYSSVSTSEISFGDYKGLYYIIEDYTDYGVFGVVVVCANRLIHIQGSSIILSSKEDYFNLMSNISLDPHLIFE